MILFMLANLSFVYFYLRNYFKNIRIDKPLFLLIIYIITLVIYLALFYRLGGGIEFIFSIIVASILILILFIDFIEMVIPDSLVMFIVCTTVIYHLVNYLINDMIPDIHSHISGLLIAGLIFMIIFIISKGGIGEGDVALISALGLILGPYNILLNIFLSFLLGAVISIVLLLTRIKSRKDPIPFGPFIITAFFITEFYGAWIIDWYLSLLNT